MGDSNWQRALTGPTCTHMHHPLWKASISPPLYGGGRWRVTDWSQTPIKMQSRAARHPQRGGASVIDSNFSMTRGGGPQKDTSVGRVKLITQPVI